jgi:imidazolonepropionase-like amidohydrolase
VSSSAERDRFEKSHRDRWLLGSAASGATVLVENGRITSLGTSEKAVIGARVIDLAGRWLLPGLIDAHVHLTGLKGARTMVAAGVTTIRNVGGEHYTDIGIRELHRGGASDLPDVVAAGYALRPDMFVSEAFLLDFPAFGTRSSFKSHWR